MDTNLMEINGIVESFKLDMLTIEQENFMNIMYTRHNGVLNESIIHEGFKDVVKKVIGKIKEIFKKLIEKVKEMIEKFKKVIQSKFFSLAFNELKQLPDDATIGEFADPEKISSRIFPNYKKCILALQQICDHISKLDIKDIPDAKDYLKHIMDNHDIIMNGWLNYFKQYTTEDGPLSLNTMIKGSYVKNNYAKILTIMKEGFKYSDIISKKVYNLLKNADSKINNLGKTYVSHAYTTMDNAVKSGDDDGIESREYDGNEDKEFIEFANMYIKLYSDLCKDIIFFSKFAWFAGDNSHRIITISLKRLGDKAKNHKDFKDLDIYDDWYGDEYEDVKDDDSEWDFDYIEDDDL